MDADFALALSLQFDDENEEPEILSTVNSPPFSDMGLATKNYINRTLSSASSAARRPLSVVDESWELIDPIPNIRDLFLQFNDAYFDGKLAGVEVKWSPKMTLWVGLSLSLQINLYDSCYAFITLIFYKNYSFDLLVDLSFSYVWSVMFYSPWQFCLHIVG